MATEKASSQKNDFHSANMEIRMLDLESLVPDTNNPRVNSGAISQVAESIRLFGFRVPIVVNANTKINAGHTRYRAAVLLGMDKVPCMLADDLTEEQQNAFAVAENRTSDFSFFDADKLREFTQDIDASLLASFDIDMLLSNSIVDDEETAKSNSEPEKRKGLDLVPFERYQYVMILCRTDFDYVNLIERLGLEDKQRAYVEGTLKQGSSYGRVIEYPDFVARMKEEAE
jgi:hypothetical protein